jgi:ATP-dependent Lhr-like helicase
MHRHSMQPYDYQIKCWQMIHERKSGMVNAPTGCGKTFSIFLGEVIHYINEESIGRAYKNKGVRILWITPLRALAKDIARAMQQVVDEMSLNWVVAVRNGDTPATERAKQKKQMPEVLVITPESLHLLFTQKESSSLFEHITLIAVDEWHEMMGNKRGVQVELALSKIIAWNQQRKKEISCWGISATIGNMEESMDVLLSSFEKKGKIIRAGMHKKPKVYSILPDEIETYPWAGHLGLSLVHKVIPILQQHTTTLIFINTRGMSERWYQALIDACPDLAGAIALHHGSIDQELRNWIEESIHTQKLKAVVCTASLDLGVDFRPVEAVIQVGSPKGISRFLQRAGRSGHSYEAVSQIYFLPTHSLELVESVALQTAIEQEVCESKRPLVLCYDVLIQYLHTLACGEGFHPDQLFSEIKNTYCYRELDEHEWNSLIQFLYTGGKALSGYDDYNKIIIDNGLYKLASRKFMMRHRMNIGTIVSDVMMKVKLLNGSYVGMIEEWFISRLEPGECFTLAGKNLELIQLKETTVITRISTNKKSIVPSWQGGRMSLSAHLGKKLRECFDSIAEDRNTQKDTRPEMLHLKTLFDVQRKLSIVPKHDELLIEIHHSREGQHILVYPFEGRQLHEAISALVAYRIGKLIPISFSIAMNDYGFELLSEQIFEPDATTWKKIFTLQNLTADLQQSMNATEMARRKFRDIAVIGGLILKSLGGQSKKAKHLQASAGLLFNVFEEYDSQNLLLRQSYQEVFDQQLDELRLREAFMRIENSNFKITYPERFTPLSFPIIADGLNRNHLSTEKLSDRIARMQAQLKKTK